MFYSSSCCFKHHSPFDNTQLSYLKSVKHFYFHSDWGGGGLGRIFCLFICFVSFFFVPLNKIWPIQPKILTLVQYFSEKKEKFKYWRALKHTFCFIRFVICQSISIILSQLNRVIFTLKNMQFCFDKRKAVRRIFKISHWNQFTDPKIYNPCGLGRDKGTDWNMV